ncbi:MAG: hypothetical protein A4E65_01853 [Syntrophorhabdus sp. PtaU1.Bin153]|nr:MAG: hypothetical protein A4E63_02164 [Syntrophorhabdus sp. PtaU1.Bin050]OPY79480.1 MAG: hypothetical protein A4E65_01853 [Syntrophorhabdus sp. PtaU1.Bin153]
MKGGDRSRQGSKGQGGMPGFLLTRQQVELNITADSHEYALAA